MKPLVELNDSYLLGLRRKSGQLRGRRSPCHGNHGSLVAPRQNSSKEIHVMCRARATKNDRHTHHRVMVARRARATKNAYNIPSFLRILVEGPPRIPKRQEGAAEGGARVVVAQACL